MKKKCRRKGHKWISSMAYVWLTREGKELTLYWCDRGCGASKVDN